MAVVAVTADNVRIAEAYITNDTGTWGNDGGGGGVADEPDFYYQGSQSQSRKIGTSRIGRNYTHGSGTDMTATDRKHWICKIQATNKDALLARTAPALGVKMGSSSSAYHEYYLFGNNNYPKRGGWQIIAIDVAVTGYHAGLDTGSPSNTSVLYWSVLSDFSATSKSENVMMDAIDIGAGLCLTGGDGVSTDGLFQDFIDADEGTAANSWGYVSTEGAAILVIGRLAIGENTSGTAVATGFTDSGQVLIWRNGLVSTGFNDFKLNLGGTGTSINITDNVFISEGQSRNNADRGYTTTEDSRTQINVTGTTGSAEISGCQFTNFSTITLNNKSTFESNIVRDSEQIDCSTFAVTMNNTQMLDCTIAADDSAIVWNSSTDPDGYMDGMTISCANASHAIEFGLSSPTDITLNNCDFQGFNASDAQNDSTFHVLRTSGTVTINLSGCTGNFSYKTAGATVVIVVDPVTLEITVKDINTGSVIENARVFAVVTDGLNFPFQDSISITRSGTTCTVTHTAHGLATNDYVFIEGADQSDYNGAQQITVTGTNTYTYQTSGTPVSPATGTIISTFAYFNTLTNASGIVTDTRTITSDQAIEGRVRKSTTSPYYVTQPITGTINSSNGLKLTIQLISDE